MVRPKIFLDTNICINVANGEIEPGEWRKVWEHIREQFQYCISFVTLKELLGKLARGSDQHFERNKRPLHVLYGSGRRRFLPYPSVFALREVLGLMDVARKNSSDLSEEQWMEAILKAVLQAPSRARIDAEVPVSSTKRVQSFDLEHFDKHENRAQRQHSELLQGIREGKIDMPVPKIWAAWILRQHNLVPYTDECKKLVSSLDAAFRFSCSLGRATKDKGYNFHRHASNWGDTTQLFYLCDPSMHVITSDADFSNRTKGSPQRSRILLYRNLVRSLPQRN
jgi:predicted nucleic acid-binding protein